VGITKSKIVAALIAIALLAALTRWDKARAFILNQ
jgi:hypothetical protein